MNTNGEDGTVSAGDYGKGDSASLFVSELKPGSSKAFYKELLGEGLSQKGGNQFQELKVKKVNAGYPATVDFEYELLTGAGFVGGGVR